MYGLPFYTLESDDELRARVLYVAEGRTAEEARTASGTRLDELVERYRLKRRSKG